MEVEVQVDVYTVPNSNMENNKIVQTNNTIETVDVTQIFPKSPQPPSSECVTIPMVSDTMIDMNEREINLGTVEALESDVPLATMYLISTVLDEETGQMINVATPYHSSLSMVTPLPVGGEATLTDVNGVMQIHIPHINTNVDENGSSQGQNHILVTGLEDTFKNTEMTQYFNEHDYYENSTKNSLHPTFYVIEENVSKQLPTHPIKPNTTNENEPMPEILSEDINPYTGSDNIVRAFVNNEDQVVTSSTFNNNSNNDNDTLVDQSKKSKKEVKVRNIDQMNLPFSYAGQSFTIQAQKLILNVYDFFKRNKGDVYALDRIGTPQEKAGRCLNISSSVIGKIRKRYRSGRLEVPGKRRAKVKRVLDKVDAKQELVLRETLQEMITNGIPTTVPNLLAEARDKINFVGSRTSFRRILHRMGFKYAKQNKKIVVIDWS